MAASPTQMADAIRVLSMDAVHKARSGHQGMPMGMADVATVLWTKFLKFDATRPEWADRDRFVLSAGHGSMLLYALLHLCGVKAVTMAEIEAFRQWGSKTPGHPEYGHTPGVETTTGPLGQGLATAVGMAMAERHLASRFGEDLVDHRTWVIAGDGCLMEGVSHEAISIAGRLKLSRLTVLFDDNNTTIDGAATIAETGDPLARFKAAGWAVKAVDGHHHGKVAAALRWAQRQDRPTMIACKTLISKGAGPKEGDPHSHGYTLFDNEIADARRAMGWTHGPFEAPEEVVRAWRKAGRRRARPRKAWEEKLASSGRSAEFRAAMAGEISSGAFEDLDAYVAEACAANVVNATRVHSGAALEKIIPHVAEMIGGSADLTGSNNTFIKGMLPFDAPNYDGRYVHYGVREFGMAAAMNGMALHGGVIPYSGTFMAFADYSRPAIRLGALMGARVIHVMTHDSIGLGEDGPTHQPVEHLASLRAMPNLLVFRPADAVETAECWKLALQASTTPSIMALSRQKTPAARTSAQENLSARGAYELAAADGEAKVTIFASGTEVGVAMAARALLQAEGVATRVVSTPCWELFEQQTAAYRAETIGEAPVRVAVEAAVKFGWERFIGEDGVFVGMSGFGASAPYEELYRQFGITAEAVARRRQTQARRMRITPLAIPDVLLIEPDKHGDERGFFSETYSAAILAEAGFTGAFVQDNHSRSPRRGTLRGLHFQAPPHAQDKLLRVTSGAILDVAVDIRQGSPTYGRSVWAELSAANWNQLLVPRGFAHGFVTLTDDCDVLYKVTDYYAPASEGGLLWCDPALGIDWPADLEPLINARDAGWAGLADFVSPFAA